jgi:hypothetical protein
MLRVDISRGERGHAVKGSYLFDKLRSEKVELQKGQILMLCERRQML